LNVLRVDLRQRKFSKEEVDESLEIAFVGGKGLAAWFLLNEVDEKVEPLTPSNRLVFAVGPATGTRFPTANRYGVFFKSPLTGIFGESYSGGHVAHWMRGTGREVFVITGKADKPTYLVIKEREVEFRSADSLWGQDTFATEDAIKKDEGEKNLGVVCIGSAGENLVRFAIIENDYWRCAGRTGAGAVMGSKNLKAIAFQGDKEPGVHDQDLLREVVDEALNSIKESRTTKTFREYGTLGILDAVNEGGLFPVSTGARGFQDTWKI